MSFVTQLLEIPGHSSPSVYLLDAREVDLDQTTLRATARALSEGGRYSSRSYRYPFALVAVHEDRVGVDIERTTSWEPQMIRSILTPGECEPHTSPSKDEWATSVWSSKEAMAKALGNPMDYDPRRLESPLLWPPGGAGRWQASTLPVPAGHVGWICWQPLFVGTRTR
jgi:hypothetical protein